MYDIKTDYITSFFCDYSLSLKESVLNKEQVRCNYYIVMPHNSHDLHKFNILITSPAIQLYH